MSDLSRVLGDLYGDNEPTNEPSTYRATAPEWATDERLDEAFASWTPGPPADAHAAEREMSEMSVVVDAPVLPAAHLDEDLAATLSAALVDAGRDNEVEFPVASAPSYSLPTYDDKPLPVEPEPAPVAEEYVPAPSPVPTRPWSRLDDDIFPGRTAGPAPKAKAAKVKTPKAKTAKVKAPKVKAPKAPKAEKPAKPAADGPKKFFGIELTFKRSK